MKAMILAAGLGNRMRPLTLYTPKPLLEVGGKPLIVWHIEKLKNIGVTEIIINSAWLADKLIGALGDGSKFGVRILWTREDEGLETAGGIINALPLLGDKPFILVNGDVWTPFNLATLVEKDLGEQLAYLLLTDKAEHNPTGDFALVDGQVMVDGAPKYTFAGLSVMSPRLLDSVTVGETKPLAPLLKQAMNDGKVTGALLNDEWVDVGTLERLEKLNQALTQ